MVADDFTEPSPRKERKSRLKVMWQRVKSGKKVHKLIKYLKNLESIWKQQTEE